MHSPPKTRRNMKKYKFDFIETNGSKGDYCFYMKYGIDTYRSGCHNDCLYCFSRSIIKNIDENRWKPDDVSVIDTESVGRQFHDAFNTGKKPTKMTSILRQRVPIKIGRNSDAFHPIEKDVRATYKTLEIFNRYRYPYILSTKNEMVTDDEYLKLYDQDNTYVQMTVTTLDEMLAGKVEQNAASPLKRIDAAKKLIDSGVKTTLRVQPLFPIYPDGTLSNGYESNDRLNYFSFDLIDELLKTKPHCIIVGFLKIYGEKMINELAGIGMDIKPYYRYHNKKFSPREMERYYIDIKNKCDKAGVNFSICYDKAENFERFRNMWSNENDCCCAKGMIDGFRITARDVE